ncbi:MAG: 2'-5' RNA ligase family protein [Bacteroidota bacterium]|nr:2'-5' RNA ligase family protein [Bacteroidota bacterium]
MKTSITSPKNESTQLSLFSDAQSAAKTPAKPVSSIVAGKKEAVSPKAFYQYFMLISPPDTIKKKVKGMKITLNKTIGLSRENLYSIAHISLHSFHQSVPMSPYFLSALQQVLSQSSSFAVKLNGFGLFDSDTNKKTIYSRIENTNHIENIRKQIAELMNIPNKEFVPHLTIARSLEIALSEKAMRIIHQDRLMEQFQCNKITILERKYENGIMSNYKVFHEINLR